jgi:hypothetical protein
MSCGAIVLRLSLKLTTIRLALVLLILSAWAGASSAPAIIINVSVVDQGNHAVDQALVELRAQDRTLATARTDDAGKTTVNVSEPGTYLLKVSKKGYLPAETVLEVGTGPALAVEIVLTRTALSEQEVEVHGAAANPVTEESSNEKTLSAIQAKDTPTRPTTLAEALPLVPGVVSTKDGTLSIAGMGENHSALLVNSVNVTDPGTGDFGLSIPLDSVETVSVSEAPYLAQYGRFTAGVVTAETRRGAEKWDYSLNDPLPEFRIRSGHLHGLRSATPRVNVSGPLLSNRLYFLEGAEYLLNKQAVRTLPFPFNETKTEAVNSFTQLDAIISPRHSVTTSFHFAPHSLKYAGLDFFNPQPVTPDASFQELTGTVIDRLALGGGVLQSTFAITRVSSAVEPRGTAEMVLSPTGNSGSYFSEHARVASRYQWIESWKPGILQFHGRHQLQIGSVLSRSFTYDRFHARSVEIDDAGGRRLQRIDFTAGRPINLADTEPAGYVQDHWVLNEHFALDGGTRLEGQTITHTLRLAPRVGFAWSPDKSGRTIVHGGIGIFYDSVPLSIYNFRRYPDAIVTSYDEQGDVIDGPTRYLTLTQQKTGSGFPFVRRSQTTGNFAPYSVAWNVQFDRTIGQQLLLRLKYLQSNAQDLITLRQVMIQTQHALVLDSSGLAQTRQFELTARLGAKELRQLFFSYVRQYAHGNVNDAKGYLGDLAFPVVRRDVSTSLPSEIPNRFLLWGTYRFPKQKIQVSPHAELRNGFPYQPMDVLQQYVNAVSGPQNRFPRYFSLDVQVSKDFQVPHKHAVRFTARMLNLTNHFNPLDVHANIADPQYGRFFGNYHRQLLLDFDFLY